MNSVSLSPVVPLVVIEDPEWIDPLVGCFQEAGVTTVEIALRTPHALDAVSAFVQAGGFTVGAGTVQRVSQLDEAKKFGAAFGLSPWGDLEVVDYARSLSWPFIPGASTPTEVHRLVDSGCEIIKIFPVAHLGGIGFLTALRAVFPAVAFLPTGGVTAGDAPDYLALPGVSAVSGSWLAPAKDMRRGRWEDMTARLRDSVAIAGHE